MDEGPYPSARTDQTTGLLICPTRLGKSTLEALAIPCPSRGALRGRHETSARDAVDIAASQDE
jgi:hypothetical protein